MKKLIEIKGTPSRVFFETLDGEHNYSKNAKFLGTVKVHEVTGVPFSKSWRELAEKADLYVERRMENYFIMLRDYWTLG